MNILVHDYAGYPFAIQLSRALARRGHQVMHVYCGSLETTPQGGLEKCAGDPACLEIRKLELDGPVSKYAFMKRRGQEIEYGRRLARLVEGIRLDMVISADTPLDAQSQLIRKCRQKHVRFVFWVQDLLGIGAHRILRKKLSLIGELVGRYYIQLERSLLRQSDEVVLITDDFSPLMNEWQIESSKVHVVPNWAPLGSLPLPQKDNDWARRHGLAEKFCFLYSGSLGLKHNPELLVQLASRFRGSEQVRVVVLSQGRGADYIGERKMQLGLENLQIMSFQPYGDMTSVFGAADVLVALLEPDAGVCSVPSKVLSYLCAGRPLLLAVPLENLAGSIVGKNYAGFVSPPEDVQGFLAAAEALLGDIALRGKLGSNARRYAEQHFDIEKITDRFEGILWSRS